jgi:uroporphyrinogen-III synthase
MRILVTRPAQDGEEIAARLAAMGHQALLAPLLTTHFHDGEEPPLDDVQAVLATSANGIRALARRTARRDVAIFAVGPQTTEEAHKCGFTDIKNANGDARALADATLRWAQPQKGVLLHVCGSDAPGTLADNLIQQGFAVRRAALYDVRPVRALPDAVREALQDGALDAALFFSPRSALVFRDCVADLPVGSLSALCISAATAQALQPLAFATVRVAAAPNQDALLALVEY